MAAPAAAVAPVQNQGTRKPGVVDIVGEAGVWVAAETEHGFVYGQKVEGVAAAVVVGAKHVHALPGGGQLFVMCVNEAGMLPFNNRPSACDGRLSERKISLLGTPERSLADAAAACTEFDLGWSIVGPRTSKWCLSYLAIEGLGFEGHHERFRTLCKLQIYMGSG